MTITTGILVLLALTAVATAVAAVVYAVLERGREWWRELFSVRVWPFPLMGVVVAATTLGVGYVAKESADEDLRLSVQDIESDCDDQLSILLHTSAADFAALIASTNAVSGEELRRRAEYCCVDEFTLVGADGVILDTTSEGARTGDGFFSDERAHAPYRRLLDGRSTMVSQRFRPSATRPDRSVKYFGLALPSGGFIQIGYRWETFEREFPDFIMPIFESRVVSETGFCVVLDADDRVAVTVPGHPESKGMTAAEVGFLPEDLAVPLGKVFRAWVFGRICRCMAYPESIAGRRIFAVVPLAERQGMMSALAGGVAFVLFACFVVFRLVLRRIRRDQARIDALRAAEEEHRARDLALARAVQRAELRTDGTRGDGYRLRALMDAAKAVGGDFYDYYELTDGRLVLTIADVSGKGIPAALFMMKSRTTLKSCVFECASLVEAVTEANRRLALHNPAELFVTVWVGVWDRRTGRLEYVSAGHNPPVVKRSDGSVEWLQSPRCAALGVFERAKYRAAEIRLSAGDGIFLYTDGVTEAMNVSGELFGNDRLEEAVRQGEYPLVPSVIDAVGAFTAGAEQSDDITMLEMDAL